MLVTTEEGDPGPKVLVVELGDNAEVGKLLGNPMLGVVVNCVMVDVGTGEVVESGTSPVVVRLDRLSGDGVGTDENAAVAGVEVQN